MFRPRVNEMNRTNIDETSTLSAMEGAHLLRQSLRPPTNFREKKATRMMAVASAQTVYIVYRDCRTHLARHEGDRRVGIGCGINFPSSLSSPNCFQPIVFDFVGSAKPD